MVKYRLKEELDRKSITQNQLAEFLGVTYQTVSIKLNGHKDFTQTEIFKIMMSLDLSPEQVVDIFFNKEDYI